MGSSGNIANAARYRRRWRSRRAGFTLIEASLAMMIVGVGILALVRLIATCTIENDAARRMTAATMLADHVQEAMAGLAFNDPYLVSTYFGPEPGETLATYNDLDDFDGSNFNPPIDSMRNRMPEFSQYTQAIAVCPVLPSQLNGNTDPAHPTITKNTYTGAVRVTVRILYQRVPSDPPSEVYRTSWVRLDR